MIDSFPTKNQIKLLIISLMGCNNALAYESLENSDAVRERQQSNEYVQKGIRTGAFTILPKIDFTNEYNSNIYFRDKSQLSLGTQGINDSYIAHFKPGFSANSNWSKHALNFNLDTNLAQYATQPSNNDYNNVMTQLAGRFDGTRGNHFDAGFGYNYLTESRGSPDQVNGLTPTIYDTKVIDGFYTHTINRVNARVGLNAINYNYQDVETLLGTTLQMSTRNHWMYAPEIRVGYLIQPEYEAFLRFQYVDASYDTLVYANGFPPSTNPQGQTLNPAYDRNSWGYNALTGIAFNVTNLITGDASIGYLQRNYVDPNLSDISGVNGFVNLKWQPTTLTTVKAQVSRTINETTQAGVSGVFATGMGLTVEHALRSNLIAHIGGDYSNSIYEGYFSTQILDQNQNRNDNNYAATVGSKYLFNRNFTTDLSYTYQARDTNYRNTNYEVNQVMLNFRAQY
jgi:hypothetical protein